MKYKVGDKVRVRKDLEIGKAYGSNALSNTFTLNMIPLLGKVVTIQSCLNDIYSIEGYIFLLTDNMIEGLAGDEQMDEADKLKYKVGDKVIFIESLMGMVNDGGFIIKEIFTKHDIREIFKVDDTFYYLGDCGTQRKVKHEDLERVTKIYEKSVTTISTDELSPGKTVKLYTWQDLCDYEILLHERWRIANEQRNEQGQELTVMHTLRQEYMEATKRTMAKLGRDVQASKAKELGFEV